MSRLSLYLLGPPRIECDGEPIRVGTRKAVALLAYVAVTRESPSRDALANLLWPEYDQVRGRTALRSTLYALRRALSRPPSGSGQGTWLEVDRETIRLTPQADVWLDSDQFHCQLEACRTHGHAPSEVCPACSAPLAAAAALYRDDFMSGFSLKDSYNFDDWQFFQAESLRREFADALDRLVRCYVAEGALELAVRCARRWLACDRLNEPAHCQLMRLYAWSGQRYAALRQYQACVRILESQLGVSPQRSTDELYRAIAAGRMPEPPLEARFQRPMAAAGPTALPPPELLASHEPERPPVSVPWPDLRSGAKRLVTVVLADVSPSLPRESDPSPEDEAARIDRLIGAMQDAAARYGAQVEPPLAGRLLAVFGGARMHENDPELAIRATLEARQEAEKLGLSLSAGISTGEAYPRATGPEQDAAYTWQGKAIAHAAYLAARARGGQILVAESTYQLTRQAFAFVPCALDVEGGTGPLEAYQVEHLLPYSRKTRGIEALRAELIGREEELAKLRGALVQALHGQGQIVSLTGEAGVGKSRLVAELNRELLSPGIRANGQAPPVPLWLEGRCLDLGTPPSYAPFADILRQYFAWGAREADRRRYERVTASLSGMVERGDVAPGRAEEMAALLGRLLSLPIADEWSGRLANEDPQQLHWHRSAAIRDFLVALCRQRPVVLVIEDLHWADSLSVDLIALLMEELPRVSLLLLCVYRPEREHRCWHLATIAAQKCRDRYTEIVLHELSEQHSRLMLESVLMTCDLPSSVTDLVLNQAQGNPFFIEEVVHSLIDAGMVRQEGQAWQAQVDADLPTIPQSLQSVILSRVDHLDEELKHVLQVAAVIGRVFRPRVLAHALGQDMSLERALWELEDQALVYQERAVPEIEYSFKHVLTQETIYQSILGNRRRELHGQVARAIEALYEGSLDEYDEQLAHHYERSGRVEQAIACLLKAGRKARDSYANEEAIAHLNRALQLLKTTPGTPVDERRELDLQIALGVPLVHAHGHAAPEVGATYARAQALCEQIGDTSQRLQVLTGLRRYHFARGEMRTAYTLGEQLLAAAQGAGDPLHLSWAHVMQAETLYWMGEFPRSWEDCERGLGLCDALPRRSQIALYGNDAEVCLRGMGALAIWHLGYPDRALAMCHEALDQARALSHPFVLSFALFCDTALHQLRREARATREQADALLRIAAQRDYALFLAWGTLLRGWAVTQEQPSSAVGQPVAGEPAAGEVEGEITQIRQGIAACRAIGTVVSLPSWLASLALACAQAGEVEVALALLDEALGLVEQQDERCWEAELHRLRGELLLQGTADLPGSSGLPGRSAEACFQRAMEVARSQQARSWELRAAMSLCRLWHAQGKHAQARALLQGVYDGFTEGFDTPDLQEATALLDA